MPDEKISVAKLFGESQEDADEVFLLMQGGTRVSRSVRTTWFFDHLGQTVEVGDGGVSVLLGFRVEYIAEIILRKGL